MTLAAESTAKLKTLAMRYPKAYAAAAAEVKALLPGLDIDRLQAALAAAQSQLQMPGQGPGAAEALAKTKIKLALLEQGLRAVLRQGARRGHSPSKMDLWLAQKLFFAADGSRRAVAMPMFRLVWPLLRQRLGVAELLQSQGIYCVFSREFVRALARLIGARPCVEVGAGDGTLSLLLEQRGVKVHATDDYSWRHKLRYPTWVEACDAVTALRRYQPEVVLCSWPPPQNSFEQAILKHPSVRCYIVIGSQHNYASGARSCYQPSPSWQMREDRYLSGLILPPELDNQVLVFER